MKKYPICATCKSLNGMSNGMMVVSDPVCDKCHDGDMYMSAPVGAVYVPKDDSFNPPISVGVKADTDKPRYDLISAVALDDLAKVYTFGVQKYAPHNWRLGLAWSRIFAAAMRHLWAWLRGEDNDPESGLPHLAHAAWGCFTLLEYSRTKPELDDRYKEDKKDV